VKPLIALTLDVRPGETGEGKGGKHILDRLYSDVIAEAGGIPLLAPPCADPVELADIVHGWLIPGGFDIDAAIYGEENHPQSELQDPSRYALESAFYAAFPTEAPVLGICYGCQLVNVLRGGTLRQHLPDELGHDEHRGGTWHTLEVEPDSRLGSIVGKEIAGRCFHHQAIGRLGAGLRVASRSDDGVIEAIEATDRPWLIAVQWHPERSMCNAPNQKLIREFVEVARAYAESRDLAK
jgi:putative glutamine amidotransferase